jgi:hypothetical protein
MSPVMHNPPAPQKRAHQLPTLREYGAVRDLTLTSAGLGGASDGGSNTYVS